jgi:hypothetical protein
LYQVYVTEDIGKTFNTININRSYLGTTLRDEACYVYTSYTHIQKEEYKEEKEEENKQRRRKRRNK